jgi:fibronectin type 3 domain-containing protein
MRARGGWELQRLVLFGIVLAATSPARAQTPVPSYTQFSTGYPSPVLNGGGPGAWDEVIREKVVVIEEATGFRLWYVGHTSAGQATSKVGYATSPDGINWTKHPGNPVLDRASQDQDICVLRAPDGTLYMYVEVNDTHLDLLTSTDGVSWNPHAQNPVKTTAASPVVWREGDSWFLIYEYMAGAILNIHLATSSDGVNWTDSPANPIIAEASTTVPDSVVKEGSTYHLYYHRSELGVWPAWHAVSTDLTNWTDRTRLFTNYSSQWTFQRADGQVWSYFWNYSGDRRYYLRYGRQITSPLVWSFEEGGGILAADSSGNGADAVLLNGALWTAGRQGLGVTFDGVDDYAEAGYWANLSDWTVSLWVKSPAAPASVAASGPVHRDRNLQINWNHTNASFRGAAAVSVAGRYYAASFGPLQANTWYHLAATYDGETLRSYKNGQLVTTNTAPTGPADADLKALSFGRHAGAAQYFAGTIDEVRIYDHALSLEDIALLAQPDPTPPTSVVLTGGASGQTVSLTWTAATDPESGLSGYQILRGLTQGGSKTLLAQTSSASLSYADQATAPSTTYYYQVAAVNGDGLAGELSNEVAATTEDAPPAAPTGFVAQAGDSVVTLDWNDSAENDLAGYHVYRGPSGDGPYTRLTMTLAATSAYVDSTVSNGVTYFYVVTAVDAGGFESPASNVVSATPQQPDQSVAAHWPLDEGSGLTAFDVSGHGNDGTLLNGPSWTIGRVGGALAFDGVDDHVTTTFRENLATWSVAAWVWSPAAPAAAAASGPVHRDRNFQLNWNHTNPSFRGAFAVRVAGAWHAVRLGTLAANTWYHIVGTYDGETLSAYVNGVLVGTNSAPSGPPEPDSVPLELGAHAGAAQYFSGIVDDVRIYPRAITAVEVVELAQPDPTPPSAVTLSASPNGQSASLSWTAADDAESGIGGYRVYRGIAEGGVKTLLASVGGSALSYNDAATAPSTTYYYQVTALNGGGVEGSTSNEASVLTGNVAPAPPTGVTALVGNAQVALDWNDSPEGDILGYHVYRSVTSNGPYIPVTTVPVTNSAFTDTGLTNDVTYFYVITAVDTGGSESAVSTEIQATPQNIDQTLAGYWPLDEGGGTVAEDQTSGSNDGTLIGGTAWVAGRIAGALSFDGIDDRVTTSFRENLANWTVAAWVWSPAAPTSGAASGPVHRDRNFQINWNHPNPTFRGAIALRVNGAWYAARLGNLAPNTWYHIVGTYDGETLNAYVNGVLVTTNTAPSGPPEFEALPLEFGAHPGAPQYFRGLVDDVRIYRRALLSAEVAALAGQ